MIIIICSRCSTDNPIGANTCGRCGAPLTSYASGSMYDPRTAKRNNNGPLIAAIIALCALLLAVVIVLLCIFLKPSPSTELTTPPDDSSISSNHPGGDTSGDTSGQTGDINSPTTDPVSTTIVIPVPVSKPVSIPYSNPTGAKQRYMNEAAYIENYEYNNLYNVSNQTDKNLHARVTYEKWDVLLNEVYDYLKATMSRSQFNALDKEELRWIKTKEAAISNAARQYKGTSRETEARYMTGVSYTKDRCYYLISLINDEPPQYEPVYENASPSNAQQYLNQASQIESYESNIYNATNQTDRNLHARVAFEKWDVLLNDVYAYLKSSLSSSEFKALDAEEIEWIKQKEAAISSAVAQHKGQSTETEVRYTTGIQYTKQRCYYLINLIR